MATHEERTFKTLIRLRGVQVKYTRGASSVCRPKGLITNPSVNVRQLAQVTINLQGEDLILDRSDLKFTTTPTEPQPNDRVTVTIGDVEHVYSVIRMDDNKCWRWLGNEHCLIRIHLKLVSP